MARKKQGAKIEDCFAGWIEDAVKPLKNKAKPANRHDVTPLHIAFPLLIFRKQRADRPHSAAPTPGEHGRPTVSEWKQQEQHTIPACHRVCDSCGGRPPCWETTLGLAVFWLVRFSAGGTVDLVFCAAPHSLVDSTKPTANVASSLLFSQRSRPTLLALCL